MSSPLPPSSDMSSWPLPGDRPPIDTDNNVTASALAVSESAPESESLDTALTADDYEYDPLSMADCSSDRLLAELLQREFDAQHDQRLKSEERKHNANSKVSLSFDLYRRLPADERSPEESDSDGGNDVDEKYVDSFERCARQEVKIGPRGYVRRPDSGFVTKHDREINGRRNACKVMEFDGTELNTGDCGESGAGRANGQRMITLNNNVFNALKVHSIQETKRMAREKEKKQKSTKEKVMDEKSRIVVFKLVNRGLLETVNGIVGTGKESVVLHAFGQCPERGITANSELAIKIFKTTLNEFKNRDQYIIGDYPLLHRSSAAGQRLPKQNPKFMIPLWAEKEMHNLNRMRKAGIACPEVVVLKKHILVMTFVGADGRPAPTLREAGVEADEQTLGRAWKQMVEIMVRLYRDAGLIHGDLSPYNLLWHQNKLFVIDVSQSVLTTHPMAMKFLWRDIKNVHNFFAKHCLSDLMSAEELFEKICGKQLTAVLAGDSFDNSADLLDKIEDYDRREPRLLDSSPAVDAFDEMFEREKSLRAMTEANKV